MREERINTTLTSRKSAKVTGKEIDLFGILETQKQILLKKQLAHILISWCLAVLLLLRREFLMYNYNDEVCLLGTKDSQNQGTFESYLETKPTII